MTEPNLDAASLGQRSRAYADTLEVVKAAAQGGVALALGTGYIVELNDTLLRLVMKIDQASKR